MRRWKTVVTVVTLVTGSGIGCGGDDAAVRDPGPATAPTATLAPAEPSTLDPGDGPLVYVTMGHSLLVSPHPGAMRLYARMLEEDLDVAVELRDHTRGGQRADDFLHGLRNDVALRSDLADADVVLVLIPNGEWAETAPIVFGADGHDPTECGGDDGLQCFRDTITEYEVMVDEILAELMTIVDPSETLVRITDFYVFTPGDIDATVIERIGPLWHQAQEHVAAAAARYGLPVAQVYDDFMGSTGTEQPETKGLVSDDGIHPTAAGAERMADLVRELGYELVG
jgi:lysophospholipase L1-like esterase